MTRLLSPSRYQRHGSTPSFSTPMQLHLLFLPHQCCQGPPGQPGTPGTPGIPGNPGTPGTSAYCGCGQSGAGNSRRWKQCAWVHDNTKDGRDNGKVHVRKSVTILWWKYILSFNNETRPVYVLEYGINSSRSTVRFLAKVVPALRWLRLWLVMLHHFHQRS